MTAASWPVGRYLAETLAANGIDTVFGIPGVHTLELYRGLATAGMQHVLVRHEQNAGFAADGYARVSGRPAAAFVISGPGLTNILTAMGQAYTDSVPMLVVASAPPRATLGKAWGVLHELKDQHALAAGVSDIARAALSAEDVREHLRTILGAFGSGRPRPLYLQVPLDLLAEQTTLRPERFERTAGEPQPDHEAIAHAATALSEARRPLVIGGGGALKAGAQVAQLLERVDGYFIATAAGKGLLPESHPANLGGALQFRAMHELAASADVVLAIGTELSETDLFTITRLGVTGRLIRIDIDRSRLTDHYECDIGLWGDAARTMSLILEEIAARGVATRTAWRSERGAAKTLRAAIEEGFDAPTHARWRALRALRAGLPADAVVCADMTQIAYLGSYGFATDHPGTWLLPNGFGALGYALPAAIGAKLAQPSRAVLALAGDFGLQFTMQELGTAVELGLSLPIVVWNNAALGQIRDDMHAAQIPLLGVVARNPDFVALAQAYGMTGLRAHRSAELSGAVAAALERRGPTLIEVWADDFLRA
jgi:5-guanidino-2-oxopentanoate decarboxylase